MDAKELFTDMMERIKQQQRMLAELIARRDENVFIDMDLEVEIKDLHEQLQRDEAKAIAFERSMNMSKRRTGDRWE